MHTGPWWGARHLPDSRGSVRSDILSAPSIRALIAFSYGFTNVLSPADIIVAYPDIMPFVNIQNYMSWGRPLPSPLYDPHTQPPEPLKIDAIFTFNDPRDWALDTQLILDLLLSHKGILGTISPLNDNPTLPNRGYQQDGQPPLYFSNPDLFWAAKYHIPRLGQGGFREAFEGVWKAVTGGEEKGVKLQKKMFGKPFQATFEFAERRLVDHRNFLASSITSRPPPKLKSVYMIGGMCRLYLPGSSSFSRSHIFLMTNFYPDNPASDILGANQYSSIGGSNWYSILVRSGVFSGKAPLHPPKAIVEDVWDAVQWGLDRSGWPQEKFRNVGV